MRFKGAGARARGPKPHPSRHRRAPRPAGTVPLSRALSKLGLLSRRQAIDWIREGRVAVDGVVVRDPARPIVPEQARVALDGVDVERPGWRAILFNKPRGVVVTRSDPDGRETVYDAIGAGAHGLASVGRLDFSSTGLLLLTNDTRLAAWLSDPVNQVTRMYVVTVRGALDDERAALLRRGIEVQGERLFAASVAIRKRSARETHLTIELTEGKHREIRRLLAAVGHEVTRLRRVAFGGLELGDLTPGAWREVTAEEVRRAFPAAPIRSMPGEA